jgi:hypothetical protein
MKETLTMAIKNLWSVLAGVGLVFTSLAVVGEDDRRRGLDVAPASLPLYQQECGSCHFAYQPGLLPATSWKKIMAGLDDHFGDNAALAATDRDAIENYLLYNAADRAREYRAVKIARSLYPEETPMRITEVPYIVHKHREIPSSVIKGNTQIGSLSNCNACHTRAETGSYSEREINVPGHGRWDD